MKTLNNYINEWKYDSSKEVKSQYNEYPETLGELKKIIKERCEENLEEPYLLDVDTSRLLTLHKAFEGTFAKRIDISTWDTSSCGNFVDMFYNCTSLEYVNVTGLNLNKVTSMAGMFAGCKSLKRIDGLKTWKINKDKIDSLDYMFSKCAALRGIKDDIKDWNTMFNETMHGYNIFNECDDSIIPSWYSK